MSSYAELTALSIEELRQRARLRFRLVEDIPTLLADFACAIADEIQAANRDGRPARLILPVGPVKQYPMLVEITNRERISWRNVWVFQMDEFLDWQGRPIPESNPLSFTGYLKRELFSRIDPDLQMPDGHHVVPHPFRIDEFSDKLAQVGGADCCFGGIGYHGHVAFNEPPISRWHRVTAEQMRQSLTRVVALGDDSIVVQSIHSAGGNSHAIPPMAVTCGHAGHSRRAQDSFVLRGGGTAQDDLPYRRRRRGDAGLPCDAGAGARRRGGDHGRRHRIPRGSGIALGGVPLGLRNRP
jgi:glucosamine-6-phosphate deaminase